MQTLIYAISINPLDHITTMEKSYPSPNNKQIRIQKIHSNPGKQWHQVFEKTIKRLVHASNNYKKTITPIHLHSQTKKLNKNPIIQFHWNHKRKPIITIRSTLTSPNFDPQASRFPQKTQVSHKHGPSFPLHICLQAIQHSLEELNLNSEPHFTAGPHSSKFSIPLQHSPLPTSAPLLPSPPTNAEASSSENGELAPGLSTTERRA